MTDEAARDLLDRAQQEIIRLAAATERMPDADEAERWFAARLAELRAQLRHMARAEAAAAAHRAGADTAEPESGSDL